MGEGKVESNGIEIWYEDFGDPSNPTVLLIMGMGCLAIYWPLEFIEPIVDTGYHVVRFDNRDTGLSTWIDDYAANPYSLDDMAADAVGLMDALKIELAHVIGMSMGGMIAQLVAINYPDRVVSLTSWESPYWARSDVPTATNEVWDQFMKRRESPPGTRQEMIESQVNGERALVGGRFPFDEERIRARAEAQVDRGYNPENSHYLAIGPAPSQQDALRKLEKLDVPTLVIHGDEDPLVPYRQGVKCAEVIPGAKLLTLKGVGHEEPLGIIPETVQAILEHIGSVKRVL